jgi:hypothetical protein
MFSLSAQCWNALLELVRDAQPLLLALLLLLGAAWVGMASWAASLAEAQDRHPLPHFLAGLALPFLYPFLLLHAKGVPAAAPALAPAPAVPEAALAAEAGDAGAAPAAAPQQAAAAGGAGEAAAGAGYGADFFRRLQAAGRVTPRQPVWVRYGGVEVTVTAIVDVLPEVAVLLVTPRAGGGAQRLRVPYARIEEVLTAAEPTVPG